MRFFGSDEKEVSLPGFLAMRYFKKSLGFLSYEILSLAKEKFNQSTF